MELCIYIRGVAGVAIGDLEDALDETLVGVGEVTGSGTGMGGSNIDIEVAEESLPKRDLVAKIREALEAQGVSDYQVVFR